MQKYPDKTNSTIYIFELKYNKSAEVAKVEHSENRTVIVISNQQLPTLLFCPTLPPGETSTPIFSVSRIFSLHVEGKNSNFALDFSSDTYYIIKV